MAERRINFGSSGSDATYRIEDDDTGNKFILAEDLDNNTILLEWDESGSQWQFRGKVEMNSNDISGVGTLTSTSVSTDQQTVNQMVGVLTAGGAGSGQSVADSTVTKVSWSSTGTIDNDVVSVDKANDEIDVLVAGDYTVFVSVLWDGTNYSQGDRIDLELFVNGSQSKARIKPRRGTGFETTSDTFHLDGLSANDTIDVRVEQSSGSSTNLRQDSSPNAWTFKVQREG